MSRYVLVPGAGGAAWYWSRVAPRLEAAGHEAVAVDLPGDDESAGLPEYAALVTAAAGDGRDVVLVGQSMGGFTVPMAAERLGPAALRAVVLVNAMVPLPGETAGQWWDAVGQDEARVAAARAGGWSEEFDLETYFGHDLEVDIWQEGEEHAREESAAAFGSTCDFARWPDVPLHVVSAADDRFLPLALQRRVARDRLGLEPFVMPGGHLVALSHPRELAAYLLGV